MPPIIFWATAVSYDVNGQWMNSMRAMCREVNWPAASNLTIRCFIRYELPSNFKFERIQKFTLLAATHILMKGINNSLRMDLIRTTLNEKTTHFWLLFVFFYFVALSNLLLLLFAVVTAVVFVVLPFKSVVNSALFLSETRLWYVKTECFQKISFQLFRITEQNELVYSCFAAHSFLVYCISAFLRSGLWLRAGTKSFRVRQR